MKSILISIKPKWTAKILNGEKIIEIRKTAPKCDLPIDVYIYCTKGEKYEFLTKATDKTFVAGGLFCNQSPLNGKVVAKFRLKRIRKYICSTYIPKEGIKLPHSVKLRQESDHDSNIADREDWGWEEPRLKEILKASCLTEKELAFYIGEESTIFGGFYAWHISDLVIFDEPKELEQFDYPNPSGIRNVSQRSIKGLPNKKHPPQSWCYVEVRE